MTKRDLVIRISNDTNLIQQDVLTVVQKTLDYITEALIKGETVELRNFGVFEVKLRKPRVGRNPNDPGKDVQIPARGREVQARQGNARTGAAAHGKIQARHHAASQPVMVDGQWSMVRDGRRRAVLPSSIMNR